MWRRSAVFLPEPYKTEQENAKTEPFRAVLMRNPPQRTDRRRALAGIQRRLPCGSGITNPCFHFIRETLSCTDAWTMAMGFFMPPETTNHSQTLEGGRSRTDSGSEKKMGFFTSSVTALKTVVTAIGAGVAVWGIINLLEGYGNDNPGAKSQGIKQLMSGGGIVIIAQTVIPQLTSLFS